jgi:TetR/AcrR family transcriptional regulator
MRTKSKKKLEIIKTAEKRFVRHGLKKTTLDEVARDLRMSKSTLYHYFDSKEDLYYQTLDNQFAEYITEVKAIFNEENTQPAQIVKKYFALRKSFSQSYKLLTQLVLFALNDTTTQPENDILVKYHKAEVKIIEEFMKSLFSGAPGDEIKKKTDNFAFLLYSSTLLSGFLSKVNVEIPDESSIRLLLSQI